MNKYIIGYLPAVYFKVMTFIYVTTVIASALAVLYTGKAIGFNILIVRHPLFYITGYLYAVTTWVDNSKLETGAKQTYILEFLPTSYLWAVGSLYSAIIAINIFLALYAGKEIDTGILVIHNQLFYTTICIYGILEWVRAKNRDKNAQVNEK